MIFFSNQLTSGCYLLTIGTRFINSRSKGDN
jgi:hypothetical protein